MRLTPEESLAMEARWTAEEDQRRAALRANPPYERGGYVFYDDPLLKRTGFVLADDEEAPRCRECGMSMCADSYWLPDRCPVTDDRRHVYPNGEKDFMFRGDVAAAIAAGQDYQI